MIKNKKLMIVLFINILIFILTNILFNIKYEQVDDFIIYNLYSGLDGTYNIHGVYIHPLICFIISLFFRILPTINWHSIFLLSMQLICFTLIGYTILKKHDNGISIILYTIFASVFYTALLMLIQYTSVAALLIITSIFLFINIHEQKERRSLKYKILIFALFGIGIMTRMQSLLIIVPFMGIYFAIKLYEYFKKSIKKQEMLSIIKHYAIYISITIVVYGSSLIIYNSNNTYKQYMEYNDLRATLHDIIYVSYENNKEIFDEIGWSKNDHYLFYTFGHGDENIYSKENLEKILNYKIKKDGKYKIKKDIQEIINNLETEEFETNTYISIFFIAIFIASVFINKKKIVANVLVFITTIGLHVFFIILGRSMLRVVIPEYIIGSALILYNFSFEKQNDIKDNMKNIITIIFTLFILCHISGMKYNYNYKIDKYKSTKDIIEYTSQNKQNAYLYTVPSLQFRYLAYSVYQMPPKQAFSNLRVIGGWDMYTQNYYDFKQRYNLEGNLLDLLKENVYLIDGKVMWSGRLYENYKENIILAIKENYNIDVKCNLVKEFDNLKIYKLYKYN